jgi:hypothetical protein
VKTGKYRRRGLKSISARHPMRSVVSAVCNLLNSIESRGLESQPRRTAHLFAVARKRAN